MADPSPGRIVMISIHPEHAEALLNGTKTVELRKARLAKGTSNIVIYATAPVRRVVGWVKAVQIEVGAPRTIWRKHKSRVGILEQAYQRCYQGHRRAVAIHVESPQRLTVPLELSAIEDGLTLPQSWRYLTDSAAESLGIRF